MTEFALLDRLGPQPLAQVMGASVVRPGWQYLPALDPARTVVPRGFYSSMGPSSSGYALNTGFSQPSPAQVRNSIWRWSVVCELHTLSDAASTA